MSSTHSDNDFNTPKSTYLELLLTTSLWGGVFAFGAFTVKSLNPFYVAAIRYLLASVFLLVFLACTKNLVPVSRKDIPLLVALGATGIWAYNILFFLGLKYSSASLGSLLISTSPLWTIIFSSIFLKEKIKAREIAGIVLACIGVGVVLNSRVELSIKSTVQWGNIYFIAASICWGLYSVLGKFALKRFSPVASTTYAILVGTVLLLPFGIYVNAIEQIKKSNLLIWVAILYMSIFGTAIAIVLWNKGIAKIGAAKTSIFLNLVPIWGIALSYIFLHEKISLSQIAGSFLAIAGVAIVQTKWNMLFAQNNHPRSL